VAKGSRLIILQAIGFVPNALTIFKYVLVVDNASYHNVQRLQRLSLPTLLLSFDRAVEESGRVLVQFAVIVAKSKRFWLKLCLKC
jgi:hypothetical protein